MKHNLIHLDIYLAIYFILFNFTFILKYYYINHKIRNYFNIIEINSYISIYLKLV